MSMISSGDASGRVRMNAETAKPESARQFREAQAGRRKDLETAIQFMYEHMFRYTHAMDYIRRTLATQWTEVKRSARTQRGSTKRKAAADENEAQLARSLVEQIDSDTMLEQAFKQMHFRVLVPCNAEVEQLDAQFAQGTIQYSAYVRVKAFQLGLPLSSFNTQQHLTLEAREIYGCAPKPEPAAAGGKPKKKAKK